MSACKRVVLTMMMLISMRKEETMNRILVNLMQARMEEAKMILQLDSRRL